MRDFDYSSLKKKHGIVRLFHLLRRFMNIKVGRKYILGRSQKSWRSL